MLKKNVAFLGLVTAMLFLSGCVRVLPVRNIYNQPVPHRATSSQVKKAIQRAATSRNWSSVAVKPGLIRASVSVRHHRAQVNIPYSSKSYSIIYKNSHNLLYAHGKIHRNYNRWVTSLNRKIQHLLH